MVSYRFVAIIIVGVLCGACQFVQPTFEYRFEYPQRSATPATATPIPPRLPQTPFPTRATVPLLDATAAAPLAAVEAQTIQLFAQTAPAVAALMCRLRIRASTVQ